MEAGYLHLVHCVVVVVVIIQAPVTLVQFDKAYFDSFTDARQQLVNALKNGEGPALFVFFQLSH